ncbi:MAG: triose-phosphate isomerase [Candidatus Lokiarchaeota archaeon]|nr:triose-phosphate isomerase [Candidatus Lokiarchaeota archaeon]MBD3199455.1 triose-phosphate isomerase [Candidatus Lokiarchaeota archaeon]
MRKPIVGGNWKMNRGTPENAREMLDELIPKVKEMKDVDIVIAPPFTALSVASILKVTNIKLGAQNMFYEEKGAYTGEISPLFLRSLDVEYVILGHSERRNIFNESNELINKKLKVALSMDFIPIVCIGEHLEERKAGKTKNVIKEQMEGTFKEITKKEMEEIIIAYEPIWAIGTGETATPEQAEDAHIYVREILTEKYNDNTANRVRIQYGGSVKPHNAKKLFEKDNIDGGLVGGASLEADSFASIIKAAQETSN